MNTDALPESQSAAVVVGDFADPLSFLASQRVEQVTSLGLCRLHWLAVQADRCHPLSGRPLSYDWRRVVEELGLPGETAPAAGVTVPNSAAATAAYAESVTDGVRETMRRTLYDAAWVQERRISDPEVIRRIVFDVLNPDLDRISIAERVRENRSVVPGGDPGPIANTRRLGYVVSRVGGPLTSIGQQRIDRWRQVWQQCGQPPLPLVITDDGSRLTGPAALRWLAGWLPHAAEPTAARADASVERWLRKAAR